MIHVQCIYVLIPICVPVHTVRPDGRIFGQITRKRLKKCPWPGKIGGRKIAELGKMWQKRGRKTFLQLFRVETIV
jgi:hypothetical protein